VGPKSDSFVELFCVDVRVMLDALDIATKAAANADATKVSSTLRSVCCHRCPTPRARPILFCVEVCPISIQYGPPHAEIADIIPSSPWLS
jgi:hypothetical protein